MPNISRQRWSLLLAVHRVNKLLTQNHTFELYCLLFDKTKQFTSIHKLLLWQVMCVCVCLLPKTLALLLFEKLATGHRGRG